MHEPNANSRLVLAVALLGALAVIVPFWAPLLIAAYIGLAARLPMRWLSLKLRGHRNVAAGVMVVAIALIAAPIVGILTSLIIEAVGFVRAGLASEELPELLHMLAAEPEPARVGIDAIGAGTLDGADVLDGSGAAEGGRVFRLASVPELIARYSERAFATAQVLAGAAVSVLLNLLIFFIALYSFLRAEDGDWERVVAQCPLPADETRRYGRAFLETGRGLIVGFGAAAVAQGVVAAAIFASLGISRALVLGVLTTAGAFIPGIGTSFVWAPVAVALAINGRAEAAAILTLLGFFVIGGIDNVIKPILARRAALQLPAAVVLLSMLGGLSALGPAGILAGPLLVRLATEALAIRRDRIDAAQAAEGSSP